MAIDASVHCQPAALHTRAPSRVVVVGRSVAVGGRTERSARLDAVADESFMRKSPRASMV